MTLFICPECGNEAGGLEGSSGWCVGSLESEGRRHRARRLQVKGGDS